MYIEIMLFILGIIFVIINGCTQIFYAKSLGYKVKPIGFAYFVGAAGNLISGNIVPVSAQAETITMGGLIKDTRERTTALLLAGIVGIILGGFGFITKFVDFSGSTVIYGMMSGVGLILCDVSMKMVKKEKRIGVISLLSALIIWVFTKDVVYTIAGSVVLSTLDFCIIRKKRIDVIDEDTEWRFWKKEYWSDFKFIKPKFSLAVVLSALSLICLNIGSNISFGTISSQMANATINFDHLTIINSLADIPSIMFGGMPLEAIISGTCSVSWPWLAGIFMMVISGILLLSGQMIYLTLLRILR